MHAVNQATQARTVVLWESPDARIRQWLEAAGLQVCTPEDPASGAAEVLITVTRRVDAGVLARFARLRLVAVAFTGYDAVDLEACRDHSVRVANVPEYATEATAELALTLMLAALRGIPRSHEDMRRGVWSPSVGSELAGKTVGIVGTGRIGMRVVELLRPFGVRIVGWSRTPREAFVQAGGRYLASIAEVCAASRVVSLHLALNGSTRGIVGAAELARLGSDAWLVNVARGALVDERALFEALRGQSIGGAALDVYSREPHAGDPPFHELSNVILLPHLGFRTEEALVERGRVTCANIVAFLAGNPANLVA